MKYILVIIIVLILLLIIISFIPSSRKKSNITFILKTNKRSIKIYNPFLGFLIYGGAGSGKTKSIAKPLLEQYIINKFAGFIYDYKDFDISKTANYLVKKYNYPYEFHIISFVDMNITKRTNPIDPNVINDENLFLQLLDDLFTAYLQGNPNEWSEGAKGILQGVGYRFYEDYKNYCTIPHIAIFLCNAGKDKITKFLKEDERARGLASAFIDSESSERTQASYLSTLTNILSKLSFNKNISYVLSGNDFDFNLLDESKPKLVSVCNSYQIESIISPVISLMLSISSRQFTLKNKIPFFYLLDEATTFEIKDFQKLPSVLREYNCSFTFLTQSASKIEQMYRKQAKASIESNLGYQFYGRTLDTLAIQSYPIIFGKKETDRISKSTGNNSSGGSTSKTISTQKEDVYSSETFTELKAGEFIYSLTDANIRKGKEVFKMYSSSYEDNIEPIRTDANIEVEDNYTLIQKTIKAMIESI